MYQVYPRSFADGDVDGIGDLRGIRDRIDHLSWLGVGAVWLSPFFPSGGADNGYDVSDYRAVDPTLGTLADFDALVDELHRRDIRVIIDQIYNHSSDEHAWFRSSRSGVDDAQREWYVWRPARPGTVAGSPGAEPNDWQSFFGGPAWTLDERSGEYYLHLFHPKQPDLNWRQPEVREQVYDTMRWWLDRGVDGFRLDVIGLIAKPDGLPDSGTLRALISTLVQNPRLREHLREMRRAVATGRSSRPVLIGEMPGVTPELARELSGPDHDEMDMVIAFDHVQLDHGRTKWDRRPFPPGRLGRKLARWQTVIGDRGWNLLYLGSHDQPRAVSRFGDDGEHRARAATTLATVLHLHRGTPFLYQGDEIAMANFPFVSIDQLRDVESLRHAADLLAAGEAETEVLSIIAPASRDNARTPMQWDAGPGAGFSAATPWIAPNPDHTTWNVAAHLADPSSVLHHHRRLIRFRRDHPVVVLGSYEPLVVSDDVYAFARALDGVRLTVIANLSDEVAPVPDVDGAHDDVVLGDPSSAAGPDVASSLQPWECRVHLRRSSRT
ncbi:MAG: alpha-glucosidase [Actinomycetota bacterium]